MYSAIWESAIWNSANWETAIRNSANWDVTPWTTHPPPKAPWNTYPPLIISYYIHTRHRIIGLVIDEVDKIDHCNLFIKFYSTIIQNGRMALRHLFK